MSVSYRVGLTGGIAAGKSQVELFLKGLGVPVLDTDRVAHEVMSAGTPAHACIVSRFGAEVLGADGEIHRPALGRIVFADASARAALNAIVHPETGRRWRAWLEAQTTPVAVVSIPLLFECALEKQFDGVLCVRAPEETMIKRLLLRGLDEEQARLRIQSQWPVARKAALSTWVLENDGGLDDLRVQVTNWYHNLPPLRKTPHV